MPLAHRKKPFSSKQKKDQLQAKREKRRNKNDQSSSSSEDDNKSKERVDTQSAAIPSSNVNACAAKQVATKLINYQPVKSEKAFNPNRFNLVFLKESPDELKRSKRNASNPLVFKSFEDMEIDIDEVYKPNSPLDMPRRPHWTYDMSKEQIEQQERKYFAAYLNKIFENFEQQELSYFEMNLETWRQLWRVTEISDIILLIVDIRFPALHFSPAFYKHCSEYLGKEIILVLNKIDMVPTSVVIAWKHYFMRRFPNLHILLFSSAKQIKYKRRKAHSEPGDKPKSDQELEDHEAKVKSLAAEIYTARAHRDLYECVKRIVKERVDLSSWSKLVNVISDSAGKSTTKGDQEEQATAHIDITADDAKLMEDLFHNKTVERKQFDQGFVTIGCCGFPNVGKSSLLNSLNGKKVVSVSRMPGHTKHLQTIFLTKNVRLCDCPGLVFPSLVCKPLQVLSGIYPIAQLQEPFTAIRFLAERIPMANILKLKHPMSAETRSDEEARERVHEWSPLDICEGWAIKRGYFTAKASRPDVNRAANELLRMALDGRLCLALAPKKYNEQLDEWRHHRETIELDNIVKNVQKNMDALSHQLEQEQGGDDDDEEEESEDYEENENREEDEEDTLSERKSKNPFDFRTFGLDEEDI